MQITINSSDSPTNDIQFMKNLISVYQSEFANNQTISTEEQPEEYSECIEEVNFPAHFNPDTFVSNNRFVFVGGGEPKVQSEWIQELINKIQSYKVVVIDNGLHSQRTDWGELNVDTVMYSSETAIKYLGKLDPNTYEKTLIVITNVGNLDLEYNEMFYGVLNRLEESPNISLIAMSGNRITGSLSGLDYFPVRVVFHTDDEYYSSYLMDSDDGVWLKDSNFFIYDSDEDIKTLGLFEIPETQDSPDA